MYMYVIEMKDQAGCVWFGDGYKTREAAETAAKQTEIEKGWTLIDIEKFLTE